MSLETRTSLSSWGVQISWASERPLVPAVHFKEPEETGLVEVSADYRPTNSSTIMMQGLPIGAGLRPSGGF